jgi:competence protein ComEC
LVRIPRLAEGQNMARWAALCGAPLALLYADFAGGSGSAWRAAWMLCAAFIVRALGRELGAARSVAASVCVGWLYDPLAAFDLSFMLSLAATSGLLTIGRRFSYLADACEHRGVKLLVSGVVATISSMLPCSVLLAMLSPSISLVGIIANVLAAPFGEAIALPLCLTHALLSFWPALEQGTALVASGALLVVKKVAFVSDRFGLIGVGLPFPSGAHVALLACGSLCWVAFSWARLRAYIAALTCAGLAMVERAEWRFGNPEGTLRVTALDVGQGDATLVDLPDGKLMLIDAGGFVGSPVDTGERVILPVLRARRRSSIDVVVLSHPHPDHFGGLTSVVDTVRIGEFWDTGQGELEGAGPAYQQLLATLRDKGVPILRPEQVCGARRFGGAELEVLAPCPAFIPHRNPNDNSFVFRISHGRRAALFTGDTEYEREQELLAHFPQQVRADLLKVGHHGSRTSTSPAFLAAVAPGLATISCGMRNSFGHPHAVTLETLYASRTPFARLDDTGSIVWTTDGEKVVVRAAEAISF